METEGVCSYESGSGSSRFREGEGGRRKGVIVRRGMGCMSTGAEGLKGFDVRADYIGVPDWVIPASETALSAHLTSFRSG